MIAVELANQQGRLPVDADKVRLAVQAVLNGEGIDSATVSVAVVDDQTIHELNRRFLGHDDPTDVLSFLLSDPDTTLDGEVVVSADTAARQADNYGCPPEEELLLYIVHGTLHLLGYDDAADEDRALMREKERHYLRLLRQTSSSPTASAGGSQPLGGHTQGGEPLQ